MCGPSCSLENHPGLNGETATSELIIDNSLTSNVRMCLEYCFPVKS